MKSRHWGELCNQLHVANFEIGHDQDTVYAINDNDGRQFDFEKLAQGETWVTRDALAKIGVNNPPFIAKT